MSLTPRSPLAETPTWVLLIVLFNGLGGITLLAAANGESPELSVALLVVFLVTVDTGLVRRAQLPDSSNTATISWLATITVLWGALVAFTPVGVYLVFPLYVLLVWSVKIRVAVMWALVLAVCSITAVGLKQGWTDAGVIGPAIGFLVAVGGAWAYKRLHDESTQRAQALHDLREAQLQLAAAQREAGRLVERARIAQELHDTTSQSLTSIQMLLRAVEAADPDHPEISKIALARQAAADGLAETRRVINDLAPTGLVSDTLAGALVRLAADTSNRTGIQVRTTVFDEESPVVLPLPVQVTLLRVAQGAIANVERHSKADAAAINLSTSTTHVVLTITDDGVGCSPMLSTDATSDTGGFGISTMNARVQNVGGEFLIESPTGGGTVVTATIPLPS